MRIVQGFAIYDYIQILYFLELEISKCYHYGDFIDMGLSNIDVLIVRLYYVETLCGLSSSSMQDNI